LRMWMWNHLDPGALLTGMQNDVVIMQDLETSKWFSNPTTECIPKGFWKEFFFYYYVY
jgi:hypothetical protein